MLRENFQLLKFSLLSTNIDLRYCAELQKQRDFQNVNLRNGYNLCHGLLFYKKD